MRGALLESFLFLFILKSFVAVGNAYPTTGSDINNPSRGNSIMMPINDATASITPYTCVYIPPELDYCRFVSYKPRENLQNPQRKLPENKKHKLLKSNKVYFTSHPSMRIPGTKKFQRQSSIKTIIYEIQRCVPPRLPFVLPWCTDEDLSDKKSEIRQLYPFTIDGFSKATYEFPTYDFSKQPRTAPASV